MKQFLILIFLIQINLQACGPGCLRCTKDGDCSICDTSEQLVLKDFECVKEQIQNCRIQTLNGDCALCAENFYLDETTSKCVAVDLDRIVDNCYEYDQNQVCLYCKAGLKLSKGSCVQVQDGISNCQFYGYSNNCLECKPSYVLNLQGQCVSSSGCQAYQEIQCTECQKNYILNYNYYFDLVINAISTQQKNILLDLMINSNEGKYKVQNIDQCQPISVQNCSIYETQSRCKICNMNFFLEEGTGRCKLYPSPSISFCEKYTNLQTCAECSQKYILETQYLCTKKPDIENCVKYDGTSNFQKCVLCDIDYYLKNNTCVSRQNNRVTNCLQYSINKDACEICDGQNILSEDGLKCAKSLSGCDPSGYAPFFVDTDVIQCFSCQNEYYLEEYACKKGGIENCLVYKSKQQCQKCKEQYYLTADKLSCVKHDNLHKCLEYSQYQPNVCTKCSPNYLNFILKNKCINFQAIQYCKVHSDTDPVKCLECQLSTFLTENHTCQKIEVENCDTGTDTNTCTKCKEGYGIKDGQCLLPLDHVKENCNNYKTATDSNALSLMYCKSCDSGYQPINIQDNYLCVKNEYLNLYNTTKIDDCVKYKNNVCVQCSIDKFLNINDTCVNTCEKYFKVVSKTTDEDEKLYDIQGQNICSSNISSANCVEIAENLYLKYQHDGNYALVDDNEKPGLMCIKCKPNFVLNFKNFQNSQFTNIDVNQQNVPYVINANHIQLGVPLDSDSCLSVNSLILVENCSFYHNLKCLRCKKGYTGIISTNRITQCLSITNVPQNKCLQEFYDNLHPLWEAVFSCHVCEIKTQLPVLFVKGSSQTEPIEFDTFSYTKYDYESQGSWTDQDTKDRTVSCLEARPETFGSTTPTASWYNIPSNCALLVINLNIQSKSSISPTVGINPLFCAACRPGYTPNMNQTQSHFHKFVKQCNIIENCTGKSWFNACSMCNTGYVYEIKKFSQYEIRYDTCIESQIQNCYAEEILEDEIYKRKCHFCKKGFILNQFGQCEGFKGPKCTAQENFIIDIKKHKQLAPYKWNLMRTIFFMRQEGQGCSKCITDYSAVHINQFLQICVESSFTKNDYYGLKTLDENLFNALYLIDNCEQYYLQKPLTSNENQSETYYQSEYDKNIPKLKCKICKEGYLIDATENFCLKGLKNCQQAQTVTPTLFQQYNNFDCEICQDLFAIIKVGFYYQCILGDIKNCKTYVAQKSLFNQVEQILGKQTQNYQYCQQCEEEYYLAGDYNTCVKGKIENCAIYQDDSDINCKQCLDGFVLIKRYQKDYCLEIDPSLECKTALIGDSYDYQASLECTKCKDQFQVLSPLQNLKSICTELLISENCVEIHTGDMFTNSLFYCVRCEDDYYLDSQHFCQKRQNKTDNCKTYSVDKDSCIECIENYFLDQQQCVAYPTGLNGCQDYQDYQTCIKCLPDMFLNNGSCEQIIEINKVENCKYYKNSNTCEECKNQYFLLDEGKTCTKTDIQNCIVFQDVDKCEICEQNYGLTKNADNSVTCEPIQKSNCLLTNQTSPYDCLQCDKDYYPSNGECQKVNKIISNCIVYNENQFCEQCAEGTVESEDKTECYPAIQYSSILPKNCKTMKKMNSLQCLICQPGYYFQDKNCVQCQTASDGCYACYPEEPDKCFVCNIGYYMSTEGTCISQGGQQNTEEIEENHKIFKVLSLLMFMLLII